ncbi:hypothetical protein Tdes44962_MAKER06234 [Teratosphaeria destructans]|uniref:Uncharacterized protein n=1 Tax=Teratosphaeria destructans TaxID=418781 RepID=A0A9W7SHX9_9PEZI|nr:hypothetical protein Tdes44962_MAKER06234 [Teratosphaeria destructans]
MSHFRPIAGRTTTWTFLSGVSKLPLAPQKPAADKHSLLSRSGFRFSARSNLAHRAAFKRVSDQAGKAFPMEDMQALEPADMVGLADAVEANDAEAID